MNVKTITIAINTLSNITVFNCPIGFLYCNCYYNNIFCTAAHIKNLLFNVICIDILNIKVLCLIEQNPLRDKFVL